MDLRSCTGLGKELPKLANLPKRKSSDEVTWGSNGKDARVLSKFRRLLGKANEQDRKIILLMAQKMAVPRQNVVHLQNE
jgi:hypothetical protein